MKKIFIINFLLATFIFSYAQTGSFIWPVNCDKNDWEILYQPQDIIQDEINENDLFIGGSENCYVIAPENGKILLARYGYNSTLTRSISFKPIIPEGQDIKQIDQYLRDSIASAYNNKYNKNIQPNFISYSVYVQYGKGKKYNISGLRPIKYFITGTKIKKGDTLGFVGYSYKKIPQPSISISFSKNGFNDDPMSPFGLKSTFKPYEIDKTDYSTHKHSKDELISDFKIFKESLVMGHPGLYDFIDSASMNTLISDAESKINDSMTSGKFFHTIKPIVDSIRDSHTSIKLNVNTCNIKNRRRPTNIPIRFGLQNDSLIVFKVTDSLKSFLGKAIIEIDEMPKDSIIKRTNCWKMGNVGGFIKSQDDYTKHRMFDFFNKLSTNKKYGDSISFVFSDNTKLQLRYLDLISFSEFFPDFKKDTTRKNNFSYRLENSETAYLDINTFSLLQTEMQEIQSFVKTISDSLVSNLIIDVRNNSGGEENMIAQLFACFVDEPFKLFVEEKVMSNGESPIYKYTQNFPPTENTMFSDFKVRKSGEYFLSEHDLPTFQPNDSIYFKGNIFILTNHKSISAATLLPALVHREKRGIVVGRETGSCYHRMNAKKFARIILPNTKLELRIPLVQSIFDYPKKGVIPWGKGVIPDLRIPLTYNEYSSINDVFIQRTLEYIEKHRELDDETILEKNKVMIIALIIFIVILTGFIIKRRKS
jgi:C-terminal processing protease CtpA/Prc